MEKGKISFLLLLKREKKCLTLAAYFLRLETPGLPACYHLTKLCLTLYNPIDCSPSGSLSMRFSRQEY